MRICMENAMDKNLGHNRFKPVFYYPVEVNLFLLDCLKVMKLNPFNKFQSQYPFACQLVIDFWDENGFTALEILIEPFGIPRLYPEIELLFSPFLELVNNLDGLVPFYVLKIFFQQSCNVNHDIDVSLHYLLDIRPLYFYSDFLACLEGGFVYLADGRRCNRLLVKIME